ncbi:MAG: nitrile hydratase subunit beta, partial [Paracoccaceae bacterium]|nr:nitrile hydratase subunit beta [Paracoccaceae bacterium]
MRVRADMPPGHVRTPSYLRGKTGRVERTLGPFLNP